MCSSQEGYVLLTCLALSVVGVGSLCWDCSEWPTKECSSVHLSPKYKVAALFGACQRKEVVSSVFEDAFLLFGGEKGVLSFRYVDGISRLIPII